MVSGGLTVGSRKALQADLSEQLALRVPRGAAAGIRT